LRSRVQYVAGVEDDDIGLVSDFVFTVGAAHTHTHTHMAVLISL